MSYRQIFLTAMLDGNIKTFEDVLDYIRDHLLPDGEQPSNEHYIENAYYNSLTEEEVDDRNIRTQQVYVKLMFDPHLYTVTVPTTDFWSEAYNNGIIVSAANVNYTIAVVRDQHPKQIHLSNETCH